MRGSVSTVRALPGEGCRSSARVASFQPTRSSHTEFAAARSRELVQPVELRSDTPTVQERLLSQPGAARGRRSWARSHRPLIASAYGPDDTQFTGSIPETYDRYLAPLFFAPYAADLARRARTLRPRRALEIAAGTGIVTRALAAALREADIIATDPNRAMLSFAASRGAAHRVRWSAADALALPVADGTFHLAVCQFGVMFFPDRVRAFREARRVLAPGGEALLSVWDDVQHNEVARAVAEAAT
jgi:SAM-dependent methyltransferase